MPELPVLVDKRLRDELLSIYNRTNPVPETSHEFDDKMKCPKHPMFEPETSYGLYGGGCGYYTYCVICGDVITKSQDNGV